MSKWHRHPAYQTWKAAQQEAHKARLAQIETRITHYRAEIVKDPDADINHAVLRNPLRST